jgi:hypothetical protein
MVVGVKLSNKTKILFSGLWIRIRMYLGLPDPDPS